jgi:hypothetical protein
LTREDRLLFDPADIPVDGASREKDFKSLTCPLWTENKARLIEEALIGFRGGGEFVTQPGRR